MSIYVKIIRGFWIALDTNNSSFVLGALTFSLVFILPVLYM